MSIKREDLVRPTRRQVQDRAALACLTLGAVGLVVTGFAWDWLAGMAAISVLLIGVGFYAGLE